MRIGSRRQRWQYRAYGPAKEERHAPAVLTGLADLLRRHRAVAIATGLVGVLAILLVGVTMSASGAGHEHVTQLGQPADPAAAETSGNLPGLSDLPTLSDTPAAATGSAGASTSPTAPGATQPTTTYPTGYPGYGNPATEPTDTPAQTSAAATGHGRTSSSPVTQSRPPAGSSSARSSSSAPPSTSTSPPPVTYTPPPDTYTPPPDTPTPTPSPSQDCKVWLLPGVCLI